MLDVRVWALMLVVQAFPTGGRALVSLISAHHACPDAWSVPWGICAMAHPPRTGILTPADALRRALTESRSVFDVFEMSQVQLMPGGNVIRSPRQNSAAHRRPVSR